MDIKDQKKAPISNSGTLTSCLADLIKLPMPALRATRSLSSLNSSLAGITGELPRVGERLGDALRVGGALETSISMKLEDLRRSAGSSAKRVEMGLGGRCIERLSRTTVEGRWNDQVRTRSSARAWHPMRQKTRAVCSTKLNSVRPEISLVPCAV